MSEGFLVEEANEKFMRVKHEATDTRYTFPIADKKFCPDSAVVKDLTPSEASLKRHAREFAACKARSLGFLG